MTSVALFAKRAGDFASALEGWPKLRGFGVGLDGDTYVPASRHDWLGGPLDYLVVRVKDGEQRSLVVREALPLSLVQPHPCGLLLAAGGGPDRRNAVVVDWDGNVLARFDVGFAFDLRVAGDRIWAAYDEEAGGELVGFSSEGTRLFAYDAKAAGTEDIYGVDMLNVAGENDVWLTAYSVNCIVRKLDDEYLTWSDAGARTDAMAVRGDRVLFYDSRARRARVMALREGGTEYVREELESLDEDGRVVASERAVIGCKDALYFFRERCVYVVRD